MYDYTVRAWEDHTLKIWHFATAVEATEKAISLPQRWFASVWHGGRLYAGRGERTPHDHLFVDGLAATRRLRAV